MYVRKRDFIARLYIAWRSSNSHYCTVRYWV